MGLNKWDWREWSKGYGSKYGTGYLTVLGDSWYDRSSWSFNSNSKSWPGASQWVCRDRYDALRHRTTPTFNRWPGRAWVLFETETGWVYIQRLIILCCIPRTEVKVELIWVTSSWDWLKWVLEKNKKNYACPPWTPRWRLYPDPSNQGKAWVNCG